MSEMTEEVQADPVTKVARNLTAILELSANLEAQAIEKANDRLMPGGLAMVALAPVANLDEWAEQLEAAEHRHQANPDRWKFPVIEDEDDWEPPLQTLRFWSEAWRTHHGMTYGTVITLDSEANFIRWALGWAWDHEEHWDDFAADVAKTRSRLENVLNAGTRPERSRVVCDRDHCDTHPRLIKVHSHGSVDDDHHKCPSCKSRFNADEFKRAHAKQLRSAGAEKYVALPDAIGTLKAQGRALPTIRKWLRPPLEHDADICQECHLAWEPDEYPCCPAETEDGDECGGLLEPIYSGDANAVIESYCELETHKTWVWWPDLWRLHCATPTRRRAS